MPETRVLLIGDAPVVTVRRTMAERIAVSEKICALFSLGTYSITDLCKKYQVGYKSFAAWAAPSSNIDAMIIQNQPLPPKCIPEVHRMYKEAIKRANGVYQYELKEKSKRALLQKIEGVLYEEIVEEEELDTQRLDDFGDENPNYGQMKVVKRKVKKGRHQPDTTAIIFALTNVDSENFKHKNDQTITHKVGDGDVSGIENMSLEDLRNKKREIRLLLENRKPKEDQNED